MCEAISNFGYLLFAGGLILWLIVLFFRMIEVWSRGSLFAESVFSVIMAVGYVLYAAFGILGSCPFPMALLYLIGGVGPTAIIFGLSFWMVGVFLREIGNWNGISVIYLGKRLFKIGCWLTALLVVVAAIFSAVKTSERLP